MPPPTIRVSIALPAHQQLQEWERQHAASIRSELVAAEDSPFQVVAGPADADLVLLFESTEYKGHGSLPGYLAEPLLGHAGGKLCAVNTEDVPAGFFRGLYSSLEGPRFNPRIHRSWPSLVPPNPEFSSLTDGQVLHSPRPLLCSFLGSPSHPLRGRLLRLYAQSSPEIRVREVKRWYDHTRDEQLGYLETMLASRFALCPRGKSCYTHRIVEAMAAGAVPVIIGDQWQPFSLPETGYYLRVPEARIADLASILQTHLPELPALSRQARSVWSRYFSPAQRAGAATRVAWELLSQSPAPESPADTLRRWRSWRFRWYNQMTLPQRITKRVSRMRMFQHGSG
jgi:hypothetical protein